MSSVAKTRYFWRSAAQGMRHAPFVHVIAVGTLAIALFTAGLAYGASSLLDSLIATLGGEVQMTLYLPDAASVDEAEALATEVSRVTGGEAHVVSKDVALTRLSRELGELGDAVAHLPDNPLPLSVEVAVPPSQRTPARLKAIAAELRSRSDVAGLDYGQQAVERLSAMARAVRIGGLAASLIVAIATVVIISATLQLAIYARREEIEIQKLVGATDRFVKAPFLIEGIFQGALGAILACLGLWAFSLWAGPRLGELFAFLAIPRVSNQLLTPLRALELLGCGSLLGLGGSFVAVGRFLRV